MLGKMEGSVSLVWICDLDCEAGELGESELLRWAEEGGFTRGLRNNGV